MQKLYLMFVGITVVAIFSFGLVTAGEVEDTMCIPMGTIVLEAPDGVESKRTAVEFPHATHFNYNCKACHHKWDGESEIASCMASGCHDSAVKPKKNEEAEASDLAVRYYKAAFHDACIGCHKEIIKQNKEIENSYRSVSTPIQSTGPTGCTECHPKE